MIYLAGIYRKEGNRAACTILTREPVASIAFIHNRMPVILPRECAKGWLSAEYSAKDIVCFALHES